MTRWGMRVTAPDGQGWLEVYAPDQDAALRHGRRLYPDRSVLLGNPSPVDGPGVQHPDAERCPGCGGWLGHDDRCLDCGRFPSDYEEQA